MKCEEHNKETTSKCTWCSKEICEDCIKEANGHKLCSKCSLKVAQNNHLNKKREEDYSKNIDPKLTEERIKEGKEMIESKKEKKKIPRIRNIPNY